MESTEILKKYIEVQLEKQEGIDMTSKEMLKAYEEDQKIINKANKKVQETKDKFMVAGFFVSVIIAIAGIIVSTLITNNEAILFGIVFLAILFVFFVGACGTELYTEMSGRYDIEFQKELAKLPKLHTNSKIVKQGKNSTRQYENCILVKKWEIVKNNGLDGLNMYNLEGLSTDNKYYLESKGNLVEISEKEYEILDKTEKGTILVLDALRFSAFIK